MLSVSCLVVYLDFSMKHCVGLMAPGSRCGKDGKMFVLYRKQKEDVTIHFPKKMLFNIE